VDCFKALSQLFFLGYLELFGLDLNQEITIYLVPLRTELGPALSATESGWLISILTVGVTRSGRPLLPPH
jgi:hypothetical protein